MKTGWLFRSRYLKAAFPAHLLLSAFTIRIVTSHPALQHVLQRTAPAGATLHCVPISGSTAKTKRYAIDVRLTLHDEQRRVDVSAWLPPHLANYGVENFEIYGHTDRASPLE